MEDMEFYCVSKYWESCFLLKKQNSWPKKDNLHVLVWHLLLLIISLMETYGEAPYLSLNTIPVVIFLCALAEKVVAAGGGRVLWM